MSHETIDLRYVEQLCDSEQTAALGYCLLYAQKHLLDSKRTLRQVVEALEELMDRKGLAALCEGRPGAAFLARPRRQEIFACFDRYRGLSCHVGHLVEVEGVSTRMCAHPPWWRNRRTSIGIGRAPGYFCPAGVHPGKSGAKRK